MILYHGSSLAVERPNLSLSRKNLDFGPGFYTTANKNQAADFARKVAVRRASQMQTVSVYDFNLEAAETNLDVLRFPSPGRAWLDFVSKNRRSAYRGQPRDLVIGPVANDDVFAALIVFEQGILTAEQTLESLKVKKLYNQFVFKSEKALSFLQYLNFFNPLDPGVTA